MELMKNKLKQILEGSPLFDEPEIGVNFISMETALGPQLNVLYSNSSGQYAFEFYSDGESLYRGPYFDISETEAYLETFIVIFFCSQICRNRV